MMVQPQGKLRLSPWILLRRLSSLGFIEYYMILICAIVALFYVLTAGQPLILAGFFACLLALMVGRGEVKPEARAAFDADERAANWRSLGSDQPLPGEPVNNYLLFVPEKSYLTDGSIHFICAPYQWQTNTWVRLDVESTEGGRPAETWEPGIDVETIASAWADFSHSVTEINEHRLNTYQEGRRRQDEAHLALERAAQQRREQLESARQLVELLPGRDAPQLQPAESEESERDDSAEAEQIVNFLESKHIFDDMVKYARRR